MLLSARVLYPLSDVNHFTYVPTQTWSIGDQLTVYLQLVDLGQNPSPDGNAPRGLRYCPLSGATLQAYIVNLDDTKKISRYLSQPFSLDGSIWALPILSTDVLRGTPEVQLQLTEGSGPSMQIHTCRLHLAFRIEDPVGMDTYGMVVQSNTSNSN